MKLGRLAFVAWLVSSTACQQQTPIHTSGESARAIQGCTYLVTELSAEPALLEVNARCLGRKITGFSLAEPAAAGFTRIIAANAPWHALDNGWQFSGALGEARIRYRVDLEGMARAQLRIDTAQRVGHSIIAPASSFLLQPEPLEDDVPIDLRVAVPQGEDFASGLAPLDASDRHFFLYAHEMSVATYSLFGHFTRARFDVAGGALEVVTADGALDLTADATQRWVTASARAVARFYGHFPAPHALVLLVPAPNRHSVLFGKVLPQSAPGVAVLLGEHTPEPALYQDWVLVHELFHIGFPSFHDEAKWLDEGSATYFEPIIRARAGYLTEAQVWHDFARDMPQGLSAIEREGLEHPKNFRAIYWGGAIACLLADVAARQHSQGVLGLEDGFRALLAAGGNATQVWSLARVTQVIDHALGAGILAEIVRKHADHAEPVGLPELFAKLGVITNADGSVTLDDHAELAALRHSITFGTH